MSHTDYVINKSKKPSDSPYIQQRLLGWKPILTAGTIFPTFFVLGFAFVAIGISFVYFSDEIEELTIDYTDCNSIEYPNKTCADLIGNDRKKSCNCSVNFNIKTFKAPVFLYYALTNFYQNHRQYVISRDDKQLLGKLSSIPSENCEPWRYNEENIPIAPCGAIANSLFSDKLNISSISFGNVPLLRKGIAWPSDKKTKFRNPTGFKSLKDAFKGFAKPKDWTRNVWELDTDPENNGFKNEDLIVWMRTSGLPNFRKLYRRVDHSSKLFKNGLPEGNYTLHVDYRYPVKSFNGTKRMIISTTFFFGGKNPFLGFVYITTGGICILLGIVFLFIHIKYDKNIMEVFNSNTETRLIHFELM
ncbi:cell cycle control protein 50A-like [Lycorma delicatula]|uniref:cell cycle control protein 50A-like n=1 Tax=Lycorma delicatula TaxID=130591 RepID=UPI003F517230